MFFFISHVCNKNNKINMKHTQKYEVRVTWSRKQKKQRYIEEIKD